MTNEEDIVVSTEEDIIEPIADEIDDDYSDDSIYNINSWGADLSFRELIAMYTDGDLLKPEMQRKYIWVKTEASRFIDSLLLGLPVPSIFLAKEADNKMLIVDGYQRIMTVNDFVRGIFSADEKIFKLTNSKKINKPWRGKAFKELSDTEQRKIKTTTIHCIIFEQRHPKNDTGMYQVFERINTSGRSLLPQEIRNCVYGRVKMNSLLRQLNRNKNWRGMFGSDNEDPRMRDEEFILRFFALGSEKLKEQEAEQISLKKFLNEFMGDERYNAEPTLIKLQKSFEDCINYLHKCFDDEAFNNVSSSDPTKVVKKFNPTIFDSTMLAVARASEEERQRPKSELKSRRAKLLADPNYQDLIRFRTTRKDRIESRISLAHSILFQ